MLAPQLSGPADIKRRALLRMLVAGGAVGVLGAISGAFGYLVTPVLANVQRSFRAGRRGRGEGDAQPTPGPSSAAGPIGNTNLLPVNSAIVFTLASTGDPRVFIRLSQSKFVAYDATCTHAGCQVDFDPANNATVLAGPTGLPLTAVPFSIDGQGDISVQG